MYYCTLDEAKDELKATTNLAANEQVLRRYVRQISSRIDSIMQPKGRRPIFAPYYEDRKYPVTNQTVDTYNNTFYFKDWLLELDQLLLGTTDHTSVVTAYPSGESPYNMVIFTSWSHDWYETSKNTPGPVDVTITGWWGINRDWSTAWDSVDTVQDAGGINATVTTLTVASVDGADSYGFTPRISAGNLLRMGTEYVEVTDTDTTANTATIRRGVHGTTAAAHANGVAVEVFQVEDPIRRAVARQSAMMYARRGAFAVTSIDAAGVTSYPEDLLAELKSILTEYQYG